MYCSASKSDERFFVWANRTEFRVKLQPSAYNYYRQTDRILVSNMKISKQDSRCYCISLDIVTFYLCCIFVYSNIFSNSQPKTKKKFTCCMVTFRESSSHFCFVSATYKKFLWSHQVHFFISSILCKTTAHAQVDIQISTLCSMWVMKCQHY